MPRFTPDGIPITMENKFDDAIYNYLYKYWKEQSGEYDPKKDIIPESEMNKMHPKTKNEKKFEQWLLQQYGMTNKEQREYTLKGNLESLWEIFSAADMVLFARGLPSIGKELAQLGKKAVDDVAEEAIEKTVQKEAAESTAKKEVADTAEDLSQKSINQNDVLEHSGVKEGSGFKFSEMSKAEIQKIIESYRVKSPIKIPESAVAKAKSMKDGYEQIVYKWNDSVYKYEVRWHTRTSGAPKTQGNTWVIKRTKPGSGGIKPSSEFLIGENEWVAGYKWYDAIAARKAGIATPEQEAILDKGHWKE